MELGRAALLCLVGLVSANATTAATFVVTKESDATAPCLPGSCSPRGAILAANADLSPDQIQLPTGVYRLSLPRDDTPAGDPYGGDLDILNGEVEILGTPGSTVIDAGGIDRVFEIRRPASALLYGLTVTGGFHELGAGIFVNGSDLTVDECWITGNEAVFDAGGIDQQAGELRLLRSTISSNRAGRLGGGIRRLGIGSIGAAPLLIENSTISGNYAASEGGALHSFGSVGDIQITSSTLIGNIAGFRGSLVFQTRSIGPVFSNSILEGDCFFEISQFPSSLGGNIGKNVDFCFLDQPSDLLLEEFGVSELALNGGSAPTHALISESPAIDHGLDDYCPNVDQRGEPRPIDGDGDHTAECDAGAVELQVPIIQIPTLSPGGIAVLVMALGILGYRRTRWRSLPR